MDGMDVTGPDARSIGGEQTFRLLWLIWVVWLPFLVYPLASLFQSHPSALHVFVDLGGTALFVAIYLWTTRHSMLLQMLSAATEGNRRRRLWLPVVLLALLAIAFTLGDGKRWLELFIYTAAVLIIWLPPRGVLLGTGVLMLIAGTTGVLAHATAGDLLSGVLTIGATSACTFGLALVLNLVRQLRAAREEIAHLAVAEERLRFARDLHDLLGHSLSLIALKSELAGRLAPVAPARAAAEIRDIEVEARKALQEVRAAVAGYRQPTLAGELRSAEEILAAAGISFQADAVPGPLPPAVEAALAWAVREGVTNVIRHSRARRCAVHLGRVLDSVAVEIVDDGRTAAAHTAPRAEEVRGGSGLAGLAERVSALGGRFEAGPRPEGGFRLAVQLPLDPALPAQGAVAAPAAGADDMAALLPA